MAMDIKAMLANTLIDLCQSRNLASLTVTDITSKLGMSRQTFYNHFKDKEDLIQWIYYNWILGPFPTMNDLNDYLDGAVNYYNSIAKYHRFMKQACSIKGQNCLTDFMVSWCIENDLRLYETFTGLSPLPDEMKAAIEYHSIATMYSCIAWIMSDMPVSAEKFARRMAKLRDTNLGHYLFGEEDKRHFMKQE